MSFNFIEYFIKYTAAAESPTDFFRWAAISAISAIARDNLFLETEVVTVYPNMYILLYAKSGTCKKSVPLKKIIPIIKSVENTIIMEGRNSLPFAMTKLSKGLIAADGKPIVGASGLLYSEELTTMIIKDDDTIGNLTDLYDYHVKWASGTQARGEEVLERVCLSILGATNERLFKDIFTSEAIYGGLLGRTLIVQGHRARLKNSLMKKTVDELPDKPLKDHLFRVSRLYGPMSITDEARDYFDHWYNEQDFTKHDSETGLESRLTVHMLKTAMILSLAEEELTKTVSLSHMKQAMDLILGLVPNYRMLSTNVTQSPESTQSVLVMQAVLKRGGEWLLHEDLVRQHWFELDHKMLDDIISKLASCDMIDSGYKPETGAKRYRASKYAIEKFFGSQNGKH